MAGAVFKVGGYLLELEAGLQLDRTGGKVIQERLYREACDNTRERRARADMGAVAEGEMLIGIRARDVELIGPNEDPFVAVRGRGTDDHPLARFDGTFAHFGRRYTTTRQEQDWWR